MFRGPSFIVSTMQQETTPIFNVYGMTRPSSNRESNPKILLVSAGSPLSSPFTISRGYWGPIRYQEAPSGDPTPDPHGVCSWTFSHLSPFPLRKVLDLYLDLGSWPPMTSLDLSPDWLGWIMGKYRPWSRPIRTLVLILEQPLQLQLELSQDGTDWTWTWNYLADSYIVSPQVWSTHFYHNSPLLFPIVSISFLLCVFCTAVDSVSVLWKIYLHTLTLELVSSIHLV